MGSLVDVQIKSHVMFVSGLLEWNSKLKAGARPRDVWEGTSDAPDAVRVAPAPEPWQHVVTCAKLTTDQVRRQSDSLRFPASPASGECVGAAVDVQSIMLCMPAHQLGSIVCSSTEPLRLRMAFLIMSTSSRSRAAACFHSGCFLGGP